MVNDRVAKCCLSVERSMSTLEVHDELPNSAIGEYLRARNEF